MLQILSVGGGRRGHGDDIAVDADEVGTCLRTICAPVKRAAPLARQPRALVLRVQTGGISRHNAARGAPRRTCPLSYSAKLELAT